MTDTGDVDKKNADDANENQEPSTSESANPDSQIKPKKPSWRKLRRYDSLDLESGKVAGHRDKVMNWPVILQLAFQSIGVVYGDLGTSPLYVYSSVFSSVEVKHDDDILGVFSIIFYTITLIPLVKYVFVVLRATDNGDGGTFALYSLICRYAKVGLIPNQQAEDRHVSNFELELPSKRLRMATMLKSSLEGSNFAKVTLLFSTMLGTSMVIGDGILTPAISVLSAVGGIKEASPKMTEGLIVGISVIILIFLFSVQRFGTEKVGYGFAPIIFVWFILIGIIGVFNFFKWDPLVIKALNPAYIVDYFRRNKLSAWISLGGTILSTTGAEALFADVGHFSVKSIKISMCGLVYPSLVCAYAGQSAYLHKHTGDVHDAFYKSVPHALYWPMFVITVLASIIASQAMISGTFSIIQQSLSMGCFPRVKIVHTSPNHDGQVYIPEINYFLMLGCVGITVGFRTTEKIGNAYGIAVVFVMCLTSAFLVLIMILIWKSNIIFILLYILIIGSVELIYLTAVLYKFDQGGYLPLAFALILMLVMFVWNSVYRRKYHYELNNKVSPEMVKEITAERSLCRMPGIAIFYSELVQGVPPIFKHYVGNIPALHTVIVFATIKSLPISRIPEEERYLFRRIEPRDLNVFRCVVRYGYTETQNKKDDSFETMLIHRLKEYIREHRLKEEASKSKATETEDQESSEEAIESEKQELNNQLLDEIDKEIEDIDKASRQGIVHLFGESEVIAEKGAGIGKRVMIDYAYDFLKRILRQPEQMFDIPHKRMLKVGMTYEL